MKKLPIGISNLKEIITDGYCYVDKTKYLYEMVTTGKYYFLSRPRRFGKTLFVDTIKEAFEGNRELFEGLYIYDKWDWSKRYPVINISFAEGKFKNREELDLAIWELLRKIEARLELDTGKGRLISTYFSDLIQRAKKKYDLNVVILIDEYDKPILDALPNVKLAEELRDGLRNLYSVIKGQDANIKFVFMTGVSKFTKVSIFSDLNNLNDITIIDRFSCICGYTEEDILREFNDYLNGKDIEEIRKWYDGYSWDAKTRVYNPFSILNYFYTGKFKNYWFESGTPSFLIELFKEKRYYFPQLDELIVGENLINKFEIEKLTVEAVLFQSGYLTIRDHKFLGNRHIYTLTYPNLEVKLSLNDYIIENYSYDASLKENIQSRLYDILINCDIDKIKDIMQSHFASIPNDWYRKNNLTEYEGYYASIFYSYFASLGLNIKVEDATNKGKVDMTVIMDDKVLVFEFKVIDLINDETKALDYIKQKGYYEKYKSLNVPIYLVGIEFNSIERNIVGFDWEVLKAE